MKLSVILTIEPNTSFKQSIQSILAQHSSDYELLIIIKDTLAKEDQAWLQSEPKIRIWKDRAHSSCMENIGLEQARGDYILFMRSGDELTTERAFHLLMEKMKDTPDIIFFSYETINKGDGSVQVKDLLNIDIHQTIGSAFTQMMHQGVFEFNASLLCFQRNFLQKYQLYFYTGVALKDIYFILQTCTYLHDYAILPVVIYRTHKATCKGKHVIDLLFLLDVFKNEQKSMEYDMSQFVMEYLASLYVTVLIATIKEKHMEDLWQPLGKYHGILAYHRNAVVRKIEQYHHIYGLKGTLLALTVYYKIKDNVCIGGPYGKGSDLYY